MEALNKNKEEIEKILKEIKILTKIHEKNLKLPRTTNQLLSDIQTSRDIQEIQATKKSTIKTSILWCEDEIEFYNSWLEEIYERKIAERLEQLQSHLTWLKEQEKKNEK